MSTPDSSPYRDSSNRRFVANLLTSFTPSELSSGGTYAPRNHPFSFLNYILSFNESFGRDSRNFSAMLITLYQVWTRLERKKYPSRRERSNAHP